jgi:hypothetical protein
MSSTSATVQTVNSSRKRSVVLPSIDFSIRNFTMQSMKNSWKPILGLRQKVREGLVPLEVRKIKYPQIWFFYVLRIVPKEVGMTCDLYIYVSCNIYYFNTFRHKAVYQ